MLNSRLRIKNRHRFQFESKTTANPPPAGVRAQLIASPSDSGSSSSGSTWFIFTKLTRADDRDQSIQQQKANETQNFLIPVGGSTCQPSKQQP